jgi:hypothetical protein
MPISAVGMSDQEKTNESKLGEIKAAKRIRRHSWRIIWLGFTLSGILWFSPNIYFDKVQKFTEVEFQTGEISQSDYDAIILSNASYLMLCKVGSAILLLGSILYLLSKLELRKRPASGHND